MKQKEIATNRCIRMTDEQWAVFKQAFGADWLRNKVDRHIKREKRLPIAKPADSQ